MRSDPQYLPFLVAFAAAACMPYKADVPESAKAKPAYQIDDAPAPRQPTQLGEAPSDANDAQRVALWWVNTFRMEAGLGPLDQLSILNDAASDHAKYVLLHPDVYDVMGLSVHTQASGKTGFSGERFWERMENAGYDGRAFREVIAYQATPTAAVAHWMETVYHRLPIIHPHSRHVGYGQARIGSSRINVLDIGSGDYEPAAAPYGVAWPPPGAVDVPLSWDGLESPKPPAPPTGYPSGPVLTLTFGLDAAFELTEHTIVDIADDSHALPHVLLTPETDPHLKGESSVALYTYDPLKPGRTYRVLLRGVLNGVPYERVWSFSTRPTASCDVMLQNCGPGKGCYAMSDAEPVCAWAGDRNEGEPCLYQNDCEGGSTCVGQLCRLYCNTASADCSGCGSGHSKLNVVGDIGACKL
ncbi:MAG: hypothetical protein ACI9OJ_002530 [Myxococcota bacterium]|jgi:uncharacterized protein YkwD